MFGLNIIDLIILAFLLLAAIQGYRRGFLYSLADFFGWLAGLVVAYFFYPTLVQNADKVFHLQEKLSGYFMHNLVLPEFLGSFRLGGSVVAEISAQLEKLALPDSFKASLLEYVGKLGQSIMTLTLQQIVNEFLATIVINALAFILIWLVVDKAILLVAMLLAALSRKTILGGLDRIAGLALSLAVTFLTITIVLGLFQPLITVANHVSPTLFSSVTKTFGDAKLLVYFQQVFSFLSKHIVNLLLLNG